MTTGRDADQAFRTLYERTHLQVLSYCLRRTPDWSTALDAASETYVVAWRRSEEIPGDVEGDTAGDTLVWLFAVARRVLANQRRSEQRQTRVGRKLQGVAGPIGVSPEQSAVDHEQQRRVLVALARLSDNDQELLRLDAWEGLTVPQLASHFDCSEGAIHVRLHRARRRLARVYDRRVPAPARRAVGGGAR